MLRYIRCVSFFLFFLFKVTILLKITRVSEAHPVTCILKCMNSLSFTGRFLAHYTFGIVLIISFRLVASSIDQFIISVLGKQKTILTTLSYSLYSVGVLLDCVPLKYVLQTVYTIWRAVSVHRFAYYYRHKT